MMNVLLQRLQSQAGKKGFTFFNTITLGLDARMVAGSIYCTFYNSNQHKEEFKRRYITLSLDKRWN